MNQLRGTRTQDSQVVVTTPDGDLGLSAAVEVSPAAVPDAADPSVRGTSPRDVARGEHAGPVPPGPASIAPPEPTTPALAGRGAGRTRRGRPGSGRLRLAAPQSGGFDDGPEPALRLKTPEPPDEAAL